MHYRVKKELFPEKLALLALLCFVFLTMYYYDNQTMFVQAINNMHRIASGKWYYILNGWSAIPYGVVLQAACAVWAMPVFILSELGIMSVTSIGARLWYKTFMLIFLVLSTRQIGKIAVKANTISEKKIPWMKLFFLSSLMVLLPAVHVAQIDIVYLFFILKGIEYYIDDDHPKFLICFMLAIPGKYMPLFIFIPLVLLKEKRYLYIVRDLIMGCALCILDRGMRSAGYRIENYLGIDVMSELLQNDTMQKNWEEVLRSNINAFGAPVSLALFAFFLLCIWCYVRKSEDRKKLAIWVSFLGFSILFALGIVTPYWIILLITFEILLIFENESKSEILFPLETIFSAAFIYTFILKICWIFGSFDTFDFLLFKMIPGYENGSHSYMSDFLKQRDLDSYSGLAAAMLAACIVGIAAVTYPLKKEGDVSGKEKEERFLRGWYWARIGLAYGWVLLNIWVVALNHAAR
ncbi:MAG: hypothetical protein K2N95_09180 [Lachnospiraceae bacterium]|nr:hypothetical protein [Lachnospiraceae bacterium]